VATKSFTKRRSTVQSRIARSSAPPAAVTPPDPDDNARIPVTALILGYRSDGSLTVRAKHAVTAATASARAKTPGHRGGFVVAVTAAGEKLPKHTIPVRNAAELENKLRAEVASAGRARVTGRAKPQEVHFKLKGPHNLDMGRLSAITANAQSALVAHIHLSPENPKIPPGG
jgi:hypothetical protein